MDVDKGSYTLHVTLSGGGLEVEEQRTVDVKKKSMSLFIQTDKAIYKPADTSTPLYTRFFREYFSLMQWKIVDLREIGIER